MNAATYSRNFRPSHDDFTIVAISALTSRSTSLHGSNFLHPVLQRSICYLMSFAPQRNGPMSSGRSKFAWCGIRCDLVVGTRGVGRTPRYSITLWWLVRVRPAPPPSRLKPENIPRFNFLEERTIINAVQFLDRAQCVLGSLKGSAQTPCAIQPASTSQTVATTISLRDREPR